MKPYATPKLVIGIAVTMGTIYAADQFLAHLEQRELNAQARHEYESGEASLAAGRNASAVEAFRRALTFNRDDPSFKIALADAWIRQNKPQQAIETLADLLEKDSNLGEANLLMARALDEQQHYASADAYYHRAIYGTWPKGVEHERLKARLELVHWLSARGDSTELLPELILLESSASADTAVGHELGPLYRQAGSASRAVEAYRTWLRAHPEDADAFAGLGQTELDAGNFRAARQAFERAALLKPSDASLKQDAETALTAMELDPSSRWLSSREKLTRSNRILTMAVDAAGMCASIPDSLKTARQLISEKSPNITNEAAETRLEYAEQLWNALPANCRAASEANTLISVLMHKRAQQS